jgi:hypothetical protein
MDSSIMGHESCHDSWHASGMTALLHVACNYMWHATAESGMQISDPEAAFNTTLHCCLRTMEALLLLALTISHVDANLI